MNAGSAKPTPSVVADLYPELVELARNGDQRAADTLVALFAKLATDTTYFDNIGGVPPALLQYIASCLGDWRKRKYRNAETHFYLERPAHRPAKPIKTRQHMAVRAYLVMRARRQGTEEARAWASRFSGLSEDQVRYLVESHPEKDLLRATVELLVTPRIKARLRQEPLRKKHQRSR